MINALYAYIFMAIILISCSNSKEVVDDQKSILGEWIIQEAEFNGTRDDMKLSEEMNLYTFFGSSIWKNAKGESFEFRDDGTWTSSMVPNEVRDKVELIYKFNQNITINTFGKLDSTSYQFDVIVEELEFNSMLWKFGNYMDVKLQRKE